MTKVTEVDGRYFNGEASDNEEIIGVDGEAISESLDSDKSVQLFALLPKESIRVRGRYKFIVEFTPENL